LKNSFATKPKSLLKGQKLDKLREGKIDPLLKKLAEVSGGYDVPRSINGKRL